ncbi:MAG: DUF542 domain-containing protein [Chloracidobacterium sp.]|nr:DUF542 domain-containing protein [Chloracidobacterium sp.]
MENITTRTVREIALESPATTRVFESYKIDYCCGGRKNFIDACELAGADPASVQKDLRNGIGGKVCRRLAARRNDIDRFDQPHRGYTSPIYLRRTRSSATADGKGQ